MAFNRANLSVCWQTTAGGQSFKEFAYVNTADTQATIAGAGYFAELVGKNIISDNDTVRIVGSDGRSIGRIVNSNNAATVALVALDINPTA